jgi:hypothetical protein
MKVSQRLFAILIAFVLLFTTIAPAFAADSQAADKVQVQFQNKTGAAVRLRLTGAATVSFNLGTGKTKAELAPGTYRFSYEACGKTNTGTFKVKKAGDNLTLPKCTGGGGSGGTKTIVLSVRNDTDQALYFVFVGPKTYYLTVQSGQTSKLTMEAGKYNYTLSGSGCGGYSVDTGNLNLKGNFKWRWYCG